MRSPDEAAALRDTKKRGIDAKNYSKAITGSSKGSVKELGCEQFVLSQPDGVVSQYR